MAKDRVTGPVSSMDGGTFKSSEEVRTEDAEKLTRSEVINEFGEGLGRLLIDAGFASITSLQEADDKVLLAITGIGSSTLKKIRKVAVAPRLIEEAQGLEDLTLEEIVPGAGVLDPEAETPDEAPVANETPEVVEEPAPALGDDLEMLDEAFERKVGLPAEEVEKVPEPEGVGIGIIDDNVVPSSADLEATNDIIPELADLVVGPVEPKYIQEYDEDILPELADLEFGPPPMMPTITEPLGASSRISRIQQNAAEQSVEDARIAKAVRENQIKQDEEAAKLAELDRENDAIQSAKDARIEQVSEVLKESEAETILYEPGATPEGGTRPLTEEEIANEAPPENVQPRPEEFGEGTVGVEHPEVITGDVVKEIAKEADEISEVVDAEIEEDPAGNVEDALDAIKQAEEVEEAEEPTSE